MDLRRGFFRLWIVASLIWIGAVLTVEYRDTAIPSLTKSCSELLSFTLDRTGEKLGATERGEVRSSLAGRTDQDRGNDARAAPRIFGCWLVAGMDRWRFSTGRQRSR
jgi:hypothetical protein